MKIPFLNNLRRGFATNSSSSHSLIHFKTPQGPAHSKSSKINASGFELEYNWEDFTLRTIPEKLFYVLVNLIGSGGYWDEDGMLEDDEIDGKYRAFGHLFPEFSKADFRLAYMGSVDHQSRAQALKPDKLVEYARDPNTVIYGGNDNGGSTAHSILDDNSKEADWGMDVGSYSDNKVYTKDVK